MMQGRPEAGTSTPEPQEGAWSSRGDLALRQAAALALPLVLEWRLWVYRRVERVELLDEARTRHYVSLDFQLPDPESLTGIGMPDPVIVPLMAAHKGLVHNFSVRDEHDVPLPRLIREENERLQKLMLVSLSETLLAERPAEEGGPAELPVAVRASLERLVSAEPWAGRRALASIAGGDTGPEGGWLWAQPAFAALASDLSQQALIFVVVPGFAVGRRVFKVSWEQALVPTPRRRPRAPAAGEVVLSQSAVAGRWRGVLARWPRPSYRLLLFQASAGRSYHLQLRLPLELVFSSVEVETEGRALRPPRAFWSLSPRAFALQLSEVERGQALLLRVRFGLDPNSGLLSAAFYMALCTTVLTWGAVALRLTQHLEPAPGVAPAVLVILPGIFAAFLVGQGAHPLVAAFSRRIRLAVLCCSGLSFLEAASLAVSGTPLPGWLPWPAGLTWRVALWAVAGLGLALMALVLHVERSIGRPRESESRPAG
jgi:hypothetical protein